MKLYKVSWRRAVRTETEVIAKSPMDAIKQAKKHGYPHPAEDGELVGSGVWEAFAATYQYAVCAECQHRITDKCEAKGGVCERCEHYHTRRSS